VWLAPILCFTAEEAWLSRFPGDGASVHRQLFPTIPAHWRDDALAKKWDTVRAVRRVVTGALEVERREKRIGASLEAAPTVYVDAGTLEACRGLDMAEVFITSAGTLMVAEVPPGAFTLPDAPGIGCVPGLASGRKCERCWRVLKEVTAAEPICGRCAEAVAHLHPAGAA